MSHSGSLAPASRQFVRLPPSAWQKMKIKKDLIRTLKLLHQNCWIITEMTEGVNGSSGREILIIQLCYEFIIQDKIVKVRKRKYFLCASESFSAGQNGTGPISKLQGQRAEFWLRGLMSNHFLSRLLMTLHIPTRSQQAPTKSDVWHGSLHWLKWSIHRSDRTD